MINNKLFIYFNNYNNKIINNSLDIYFTRLIPRKYHRSHYFIHFPCIMAPLLYTLIVGISIFENMRERERVKGKLKFGLLRSFCKCNNCLILKVQYSRRRKVPKKPTKKMDFESPNNCLLEK